MANQHNLPLRGPIAAREWLLRLSPVLMAPIAIAVTCLDFAKYDDSLVKAGMAALMVGAPLAVGATVFLAVLAMRRIDELQRSEDPQLEIEVIDTGIGISEEQLATLFTPFTQADASTTRKYGGTGLGLAICKRLASVLGGEVAAESVLGQGSIFRLSIPLRAASSVARPHEVPAASAPVPEPTALDCRVLLVEDGPDNQRLIAFLLRKAGAEVTLADDGRAAVEAVVGDGQPPSRGDPARAPFDVILMDIQMPVMDGFEATRRIRAAGHRGPIIALTAHASADDRQRCLDAGCDDYLSKPIDRGELLRLVARHAGPQRRPTPPIASSVAAAPCGV